MAKLTPPFLQIPLSTLFIFFLFSHGNSQSELYDQEQRVLLSLVQFWQYPPSLSHWSSSSASHCSWPEIICTDGSVTSVTFFNMNITGTIPPFICDLKNLSRLDFSYNYIPGGFPKALYNCSKLDHLDLSQNYFVGPIPDDVDQLSRLYYLSVEANNFSGDIPASIGRLPELRFLYLSQNQFNGTFPAEIGNLSNLEELRMPYNRKFVPMRFPSNFTQLKKLKYLWIAQSNLIGELPEGIGEMAALEHFDLSDNDLTGKLPSGLFQLKNLSILYLFKNRFSGDIPGKIDTPNLTVLDLSDNNLTGKIPDDIGKLQQLTGLSLFWNQLSGEIPASIGRLPALIDVRLYGNRLSGVLPPDFGRYSSLEGFEVSANNLTGTLPEHLCYGGKLVGLVAYDNNLNGELPESLGNCNSLLIISVYNNNFSGEIPRGVWTLLNLTHVSIYDNSFSGELPEKVSWNLSRLDISNNKFSGMIPIGVSTWRNLVVFSASNNLFSGTIPQELTALPSLMTLLLDRNQFSGVLPSNIISWRSLTTLNLSHNVMSGHIPREIGLLPVLTDLDLSDNQFAGQIPSELGQLRLTSLNLSSNHLTGRIPSELDNSAYAGSFSNNPGLCASSSSPLLSLNGCDSQTQKSNKLSSRQLALIISLGVAVFVLSLIFSLFIVRIYQKRKCRVDSIWNLTSFQKLNFTESDILSGLTENNVIGSGGSGKVYRVPVNRRSDLVAVKKIWNNRKLEVKLEKEFTAEVKILSSIRHTNIVKLLCCISSENSKLLVYEYMENHSLDKWLHSKKRPSTISASALQRLVFDWPKRLQVAIGAAKGLCYMHHDCVPPVVHRDIKSSNILLDSEFKAKIADFGLAKMLINQGEPATMSAVAGSFGYIAPEYAHTTKVDEKIDVYSFGVILLELVTGREAHSGDEYTCLADWALRQLQEGSPLVDALDEEIKDPSYVDKMCSVFKLGVICTGPFPSSRPSMKDVLQILLRCDSPRAYADKAGDHDVVPFLRNSKREQKLEDDIGFESLV